MLQMKTKSRLPSSIRSMHKYMYCMHDTCSGNSSTCSYCQIMQYLSLCMWCTVVYSIVPTTHARYILHIRKTTCPHNVGQLKSLSILPKNYDKTFLGRHCCCVGMTCSSVHMKRRVVFWAFFDQAIINHTQNYKGEKKKDWGAWTSFWVVEKPPHFPPRGNMATAFINQHLQIYTRTYP